MALAHVWRVTGWLFLSVIPVGLPAALHIATGFGQALFGWHDSQLLLAELGTLAIVWWVGSRGASSSANLQTLVAVLIVALIVAIWWRGGISPAQIPFRRLLISTVRSFFRPFGDVLVFCRSGGLRAPGL
jgi:amino acid efflux transporter